MKLKNKKTIIILASVLAVVIATIVAIVLIIRSNDEKPEVATQTEIVTVTDDNGDTVTDEEGEAVTEVVTVTEADTDTTTNAGGTTAHGTTATTASSTTTEHNASSTTEHSTTQAPATTQHPSTTQSGNNNHQPTTTQQPTTQAPATTQTPTTQTPTTQTPTTQQPTTQAPSTQAPASCNHNYQEVTKTTHVSNDFPITESRAYDMCNQCGKKFYAGDDPNAHLVPDVCWSWSGGYTEQVPTGRYTHEEYDQIDIVGYKCSICGDQYSVTPIYKGYINYVTYEF